MLRYTEHPLLDVGVATITAFAQKSDPTQLTEKDLDAIADYIEREYVQDPLKSFLTVAFPNSGFTQPAYEAQPEKRKIYAQRVTRAYKAGTPTLDAACVFTGEPAAAVSFDVKGQLEPGRTFRQHIPLITAEDVINFHPGGVAGLPVSGKALLAFQALPLGCAKCAGRLLAVHSDNEEIILHFATTFLQRNRQALQLAHLQGSKKLPEAQQSHRTLLIHTLLEADQMRNEARLDERPFSLTVYHLSNSGQGVDLDIYYLPLEIVAFLKEMYTAAHRVRWSAIVQRAWELEPQKRGAASEAQRPFEPRRNWLYEDLFRLPENAPTFVRTYFLRHALRSTGKGDAGDPRQSYSLRTDTELVSWDITSCFLRRIMKMEKERVEHIRALGDRLADYVSGQNDRRFFRDFFVIQRYDDFRSLLIKANLLYVRQGHAPLIELDPYIEVFEEGDELPHSQWRLARDLVLIRMIERLHQLNWLGKNIDVIPEVPAEEETQAV